MEMETSEKEQEARSCSPLTLAFLGDAVYEREIRERVVRSGSMPPGQLHRKCAALAKAASQAAMIRLLEADLTQEEEAVFKRGRNAHSATMAKNATMADYRAATGFEALMGYLFLCGREDRAKELIDLGIQRLPEELLKKPQNGTAGDGCCHKTDG